MDRPLTTRSDEITRYIGVDLHTSSFTTCVRTGEGAETFVTYRLPAAGLVAFRATLQATDELAVEATGNSVFFRDQV